MGDNMKKGLWMALYSAGCGLMLSIFPFMKSGINMIFSSACNRHSHILFQKVRIAAFAYRIRDLRALLLYLLYSCYCRNTLHQESVAAVSSLTLELLSRYGIGQSYFA